MSSAKLNGVTLKEIAALVVALAAIASPIFFISDIKHSVQAQAKELDRNTADIKQNTGDINDLKVDIRAIRYLVEMDARRKGYDIDSIIRSAEVSLQND
jgi:hypothetical protein